MIFPVIFYLTDCWYCHLAAVLSVVVKMSDVNMATPVEGVGFNKRQNVVVQPLLTGNFFNELNLFI